MQRKILLIIGGTAALAAMEVGYSVAIHNEAGGGTHAKKTHFALQGPITETLSTLTNRKP